MVVLMGRIASVALDISLLSFLSLLGVYGILESIYISDVGHGKSTIAFKPGEAGINDPTF